MPICSSSILPCRFWYARLLTAAVESRRALPVQVSVMRWPVTVRCMTYACIVRPQASATDRICPGAGAPAVSGRLTSSGV